MDIRITLKLDWKGSQDEVNQQRPRVRFQLSANHDHFMAEASQRNFGSESGELSGLEVCGQRFID